MTYPVAVSIPDTQTVGLNYHFPLKEREQVELNHEYAITKSSQLEIRGRMAGFFNR